MKYSVLTGTGLTVSRFCLGTMTFGDQVSEEEGIRILHAAVERGINFIDTANTYTGGASECITGKGIKEHRHQLILASKVCNPVNKQTAGPNEMGLTRRHIRASVTDSLRRLDTDYLDLYYLHKPDYLTPLEETLEAMNSLVREGLVRYVGISNYASWQLMDMLWICDKRNYVSPIVTQNVYNVITRDIEQELVPCITAKKVGLVIFNPIAGGLLSGKHKWGVPTPGTRFDGNSMYIDRFWNEDSFRAVDELKGLAEKNGMSLLELSHRWCFSQPWVDSVLTGMSSLAQFEQNVGYADLGPLPADLLEACDDMWKRLKGTRFTYNR